MMDGIGEGIRCRVSGVGTGRRQLHCLRRRGGYRVRFEWVNMIGMVLLSSYSTVCYNRATASSVKAINVHAIVGKTQGLLRRGWGGVRRGLVDLLFPGTCASCGKELALDEVPGSDVPFCADCLDSLELFDGPMCSRC